MAARRFLTTAEAVAEGYLSSEREAKRLRSRADGPVYYRFGRSIRYRREDLEQWVERHRIRTQIDLPATQRPHLLRGGRG